MDDKPESKLLSEPNHQLYEIDLFADDENNLDNGGEIEINPLGEIVTDSLKPVGGCEHQNLVEIRELLIKLGSAVLELTTNLDRAQATIKDRDAKLAETELELAKAKEESIISHLTKLHNKKYFDEIYKIENFNPDRDRNNIAIIYVDINKLKVVNDTFGYKTGDDLIMNVAEFLKNSFRPEDTIIHPHGDEFIVICRDRDGIDEAKLQTRVNEIISLSQNKISAGFAVFNDKIHDDKIDLDLDDTERRAAQEMHRVKLAMGAGR